MKALKNRPRLMWSLLAGFGFVASVGAADIIFRPGPGLNDGSDEGGIAGGKDSTALTCLGVDGTSAVVISEPRSSCNPCNEKGYIQFDVSNLPASVKQVFLSVEEINVSNCHGGNCEANFYFYQVTEPWNEITLGNGSAPTPAEGAQVLGPLFRTSIPPGSPGGRFEYDITEVYRGWKNGSIPNHGLVVYSPEGTCNNGAARFQFYSSDDSTPAHRPALRIVPAQPTIVALALHGGDGATKAGWTANGSIWDTVENPAWVLGVSDEAKGTLLNQPDSGIPPLTKGNHWLYAEPDALGGNPKLVATLSDGGTLSTVFKLKGTAGTLNKWPVAFGSPLLSLGWAKGMADKVGGPTLAPSGTNDLYMRMEYFGLTGGAATGVSTTQVECKNLTSGKSVLFTPQGSSWNCEAKGLKVEAGDQIQQIHDGTAE